MTAQRLRPATVPHFAGASFSNPVLPEDFADPFILRVNGAYYAYATNTADVDLPVRRSTDLIHWETLGDAMGPLPTWVTKGLTWAPDIMPVTGGFVLYYTARHTDSGQQVIGAAFSESPEGPFIDHAPAPLIAQHDLGGAIDAHAFIDTDGQRYLYWKNDGNSCGQRTYLWVQRLSDDGLQLLDEPRALLRNDLPWERHLIEAPFVHARGGLYHLFYSAAHYGDDTYCVGHAVGHSPMGPFTKMGTPLLCTTGDTAGPGGQGVLTDASGLTWMYYHAWTTGQEGYEHGGVRSLRFDLLGWDGEQPIVHGPSTTDQLAPATLAIAAD